MSSIIRPDVTPAQKIAGLVAGVPIISNLLSAFGVFTVSPLQQQTLQDTLTWGGVLAGLLIAGDTGLRAARNAAQAKVDAALLTPVEPPTSPQPVGIPPTYPTGGNGAEVVDQGVDIVEDADLPSDDEELASPPPDESNTPVQPSQG